MELPNREQAFIPREKLTDYLLSLTHPVGKAKARFFRSLGFDNDNVDWLERELLAIGQSEKVDEVNSSVHGVKYAIEGLLAAPSGTIVRVRTVWIIGNDETRPRFVTAYPA